MRYGPAQVRAAQVGPAQVAPDEVGSAAVGPPGDPGAGQLAGRPQQGVDPAPERRHVQRQQVRRAGRGEPLDLVAGPAELVVQRAGGVQRERLGQVPEQLVQLAHHRERGEHRLGQLR